MYSWEKTLLQLELTVGTRCTWVISPLQLGKLPLLLANELHKTRKTTAETWIRDNPDVDVSQLNLPVECSPSPATIAANTITSGGATGSTAAASTIAVATAQHTRTAPTEEELQRVPPKPDAMPGEFGTCPRCEEIKARWKVTRNGRPWYRCHRFPTGCNFAVFGST